jgi:predicted TIM-barrel fold metal-dependent hydrolase
LLIDCHVHFTRSGWLEALWSPELRRNAALWPRLQLLAGMMASPDAIDAALASRGVDHAIIYPELSVAPGPRIMGGPTAALALTRQMNDATADLVARAPARFAGLAVVNPFGNQGDMAELRRAIVALGLCGVAVGASYSGQGIDAPSARPFLEQVAMLEVPLVLHPTVDSPFAGIRDFGLDLLVGMPAGMLSSAIRLMASGICEDFPSLQIILTHLGGGLGGIIPWLDANTPGLQYRFAQRARHFYVDSATASSGAVQLALETFGPQHVLFGSDWPITASPNPHEAATDAAGLLGRLPLGIEGRAAILAGTAIQLFGLSLL